MTPMLLVLTILIFLITLAFSVSGIYFLVEAPAARKKLRSRLAAIQQTSEKASSEPEIGLLREETLESLPVLGRLFFQIPIIEKLQIFMQQAAMKISVTTLLLISFSLAFFAFLAGLLLGLPAIFLAVIAACAGASPFAVIAVKRQRRFSKFEELFPDAIDLLARAVRAGHAFTTGLELIAQEMPEPLAGEFRITYEQQNLGMPLREALENMSVRVPAPDVRFFVSALQIQRESGGNLAEVLDKLSTVIRERFKIMRQVQVLTAEGRLTLYMLTALPPVTGIILYLVNPKYIMRLFEDPSGQKALALAIVLQIAGYLVIRSIVRIKV